MAYRLRPEKLYISRVASYKFLKLNSSEFKELCILTDLKAVKPKNNQKYDRLDKIYYKIDEIESLKDSIQYITILKRRKNEKRRDEFIKDKRQVSLKRIKIPEHDYNRIIKEMFPDFKQALSALGQSLDMLFAILYLKEQDIKQKENNSMLTDEKENMNAQINKNITKSCPNLNDKPNSNFDIKDKDNKVLSKTRINYTEIKDTLNEWKDFILQTKICSNIYNGEFCKIFKANINGFDIIWREIDSGDKTIRCGDEDIFESMYGFSLHHLRLVLNKLKCLKIDIVGTNVFHESKFYLTENDQLNTLLIESGNGEIVDNNADYYISNRIVKDMDANRQYIHSQFIYDSFNRNNLCKPEDYFLGGNLPEKYNPFSTRKIVNFDPDNLALMSKKNQEILQKYIREIKK